MFKYNNPELKNIRKELRNNSTKSERVLWSQLKGSKLNHKFRRQFGIGRYVLDFYCPEVRLCVEVDGITHDNETQINKDEVRDKYLKEQNIYILRFTTQEIFFELDKVVKTILAWLQNRPS